MGEEDAVGRDDAVREAERGCKGGREREKRGVKRGAVQALRAGAA